MFRIDDPTAATSLPTPEAAGTEGYFTSGNPQTATPATIVRSSWLNQIQEELRAIVVAAGITPSKTTYNQVLTALQTLIQANTGFGFKNLKVATLSTTQIQTTADQLVLQDGSGHNLVLSNVNVTASTGTVGANGVDVAGALAANTPLSKWVIYNPTTSTAAALLSQSQTSPTMPSGYTFKARVGYAMVNATPTLIPTLQYGRRGKYTGSNSRTIASTTSTSGIGATQVSLSGYVPPTACAVLLATQANAGSSGAYASTFVGPQNGAWVAEATASWQQVQNMAWITLEALSIWWMVVQGATTSLSASVTVVEWEDNL